jgi:hypothetical protein
MEQNVVEREKQSKERRNGVENLPIWRAIAEEEESRMRQKSHWQKPSLDRNSQIKL